MCPSASRPPAMEIGPSGSTKVSISRPRMPPTGGLRKAIFIRASCLEGYFYKIRAEFRPRVKWGRERPPGGRFGKQGRKGRQGHQGQEAGIFVFDVPVVLYVLVLVFLPRGL